MARRSRTQLVLALEREEGFPPVTHRPEELVQALADLLLEALGVTPTATREGARDDLENHT